MPAAVPSNVGPASEDTPPGHRFRLYFSDWRAIESGTRGHEETLRCLKALVKASGSQCFQAISDALSERQSRLASCQPDGTICTRKMRTEAPLVCGTGVEHPIENGLLFYDPHGLPYLPGSSVKGTLRRAAEELALFPDRATPASAWTLPRVWLFFGFDKYAAGIGPNSPPEWREAYRRHIDSLQPADLRPLAALRAVRQHLGLSDREPEAASLDRVREFLRGLVPEEVERPQAIPMERRNGLDVIALRGAVECWDVFFRPPRLRLDIMNPHFHQYYQEHRPPHETASPTPIYFLAVDVGVRADFRFQWRPPRGVELPHGSAWMELLSTAFDHAARTLGFGAKTAVGYGRFSSAEASARSSGPGAEPSSPGPAASLPVSVLTEQVVVTWNPGDQSLTAMVSKGKLFWRAHEAGEAGKVLLARAGALLDKLKKKRELMVFVEYEARGNLLTLLGLSETDPSGKGASS